MSSVRNHRAIDYNMYFFAHNSAKRCTFENRIYGWIMEWQGVISLFRILVYETKIIDIL